MERPADGIQHDRARVEMRELLRELGAMGKTVILSSHILAELAELCDSIGIIERGQLVVSGRLADVRARVQAGRLLRIRVLSNPQQVETLLRAQPGVGQVYPVAPAPNGGETNGSAANGNGANGEADFHEMEVEFAGSEEAVADLLETLIASKARIASFSETHTGLEEVFLRLTKGEVA